ncbi:MAG: M48 family metallopeptidase [Ignavibacteriaceae bacterium]|nr:M48 family metallopeptidase [Ignavibacteriaceae bacterium]
MSDTRFKDPEKSYFYYLGNEIKIVQSFDLFLSQHKISFKEGQLHIASPHSSRDEIKFIFDSWLNHLAKKYIRARTELLKDGYGFKINKIIIRGQRTLWGSCSSKANLSFNYKLMKYREEVIDYVIIHELCHLKVMNHSPKFWSLVETHCPNFKSLKKELKSP